MPNNTTFSIPSLPSRTRSPSTERHYNLENKDSNDCDSNKRRPLPANLKAIKRPYPDISDDAGIDWEWVKGLDQQGEGYLPARLTISDPPRYTGEDTDRPIIENVPVMDSGSDLHEYTCWILARIKKMSISRIIVRMMKDKNFPVKWVMVLNTCFRNRRYHRYRVLKLDMQQPANHEAAYAQMCGIVLPPEQSCTSCKAGNGAFQNCVVLPGYINGACANCHYNSNASKCSHRPATSIKRTRLNDVSTATEITLPPIQLRAPRPNKAEMSLAHIRNVRAAFVAAFNDVLDVLDTTIESEE